MEIEEIKTLAISLGWCFVCFQENIGMISFKKKNSRINIYITKMTVGTCIDHPKKGKTQLFRKNVDKDELYKILKNPRTHLNKGYYTKCD